MAGRLHFSSYSVIRPVRNDTRSAPAPSEPAGRSQREADMRRHGTNLQGHLLRVAAGAVLTLCVGVGQASAAYVGGAVDLTTANSTATITAAVGGDFIVYQIDPQSTGTGVIDSFLRVQDNGTANGYNTDASGVYDNLAGNFTHSLLLSDVPIVTVGNTTDHEFSLDINQAGNNTATLLSLNQLQFFTANGDPGATNTLNSTEFHATAHAGQRRDGRHRSFQVVESGKPV